MADDPLPSPRLTVKTWPKACPIQVSLGVLGRTWALVVLRDVALFEGVRFSDIIRMEPGLTPRVLSARLRDLTSDGFVVRRPDPDGRSVRYDLTAKGRDAVPVLTALMQFAFRHHAEAVFEDGRPRTIGQVFPGAQRELLRGLVDYARR